MLRVFLIFNIKKISCCFCKPEYPYSLYVDGIDVNAYFMSRFAIGPDIIGMNTKEECIKIIEEIEKKREFLRQKREKKSRKIKDEYLKYKKLNLKQFNIKKNYWIII